MLQSPSSISLFLPLSFYVHQHINFCIDMNSGHFCSQGAVSKSALWGGARLPLNIFGFTDKTVLQLSSLVQTTRAGILSKICGYFRSSAWLLPQEQPSPLGRDIAKI
jgi:hypothetical protein